MRTWTAFSITVLLLTAALIWSQVKKPVAPVGAQPIVNLIADSEHELMRLPVAFAPLPDSEEIRIGKELEQKYGNFWQPSGEDRAVQSYVENYVQKVGARVAAHAHRKLPYRFHYIPGLRFVNAFALPGGAIFIGGGLISLMTTEDELAAVLGHEVEHVDHYHCAERVQIEAALQRVPLGELVGIPLEIFVMGYSKSQELEADREGTRLAAAAGYSPQGAIEMFQAFERFEPQKRAGAGSPAEEVAGVASDALEGYFRSHPLNEERIDQIRKLIESDELPDRRSTKPLAVAYVFLTERALECLESVKAAPYTWMSPNEKRAREAERKKQYNEAIKLASQSLALVATQPRAMEIIGLADLGLDDFTGAAAMYHNLLPQFPAFADDIRTHVDALAQSALAAEHYAEAAKMAGYALELQPSERDALKILAEAQFALADVRDGDEFVRKLRNMYPETAEEALNYLNQATITRFGQGHYQDAASLASESNGLRPDQREILSVLGNAQFALANFSAAVPVYRKLLDQDASDVSILRSYTDALASTGRSPAMTRDFETWMAGVHAPSKPLAVQMRVEDAGLHVLNGDEALAKAIVEQARSNQGVVSPELLGRLGWWYYRAGNYNGCAAVVHDGVQMRPGDPGLQLMQGWIDIEQHQFQNAIRLFESASAEPPWNSPLMAMAIASWQAHRDEEALERFDYAAKTLPQWRNPQWVSALYSPFVAHAAIEMDTEWQKRQSAKFRNGTTR